MRNPKLDGLDHINIYSKGQTELGRLLSNFAHTPIDFEPYGHFESIEGFWFWLLTKDERLRDLYGYEAKKLGQSLPTWDKNLPSSVWFKDTICRALEVKVEQHPYIAEMLAEETLPFDHYYVFDGKPRDAGFKWLVHKWESIRSSIQDGRL